jgi:hypothetical protein
MSTTCLFYTNTQMDETRPIQANVHVVHKNDIIHWLASIGVPDLACDIRFA